MALTNQTGLAFRITPASNGDIAELGPAGGQAISAFSIQFVPSIDWVGQLAVMGKTFGKAAAQANAVFDPVPYRRVSISNVASDYALVSDLIADRAIILIPAYGLSIGLLQACSAGYMDVSMWRLDGGSAV